MPPELADPLPPHDRHQSVADWLGFHGITARTQPIRSSDYGLITSCPFVYYLSRRLGLCDPLKWSQVLNRGTWFHKRLECLHAPLAVAHTYITNALTARKEELTAIYSQRGVMGNALDRLLAREEKDAYEALAWFDSAVGAADSPGICIPGNAYLSKGAQAFFSDPSRVTLATEKKITLLPSPSWLVPITIQVDRLYYNTRTNAVWLLDAKTTTKSPTIRAAQCPWEFQRRLYSYVIQTLMSDGRLQRHYNLPSSATFGGMCHMIVQCGSIEFGSLDRPYREYPHELKSGPRKGQIEIRREYISETPSWDNFRKRAREWHRGEGSYIDEAGFRKDNPCIELSFTGPLTPEEHDEEFWPQLLLCREYAERAAVPANFPRTSDGVSRYSELSEWARFFTTPPADWPTLISELNLIQAFRDENTPVVTADDISIL